MATRSRHGNPPDLRRLMRRQLATTRARWQRPDRVLRVLRLRRGAVVADVGSGPGYFTTRLARAVGPRGRVYAVDPEPEVLSALVKRLDGAGNVTPVLSRDNDPMLPPASCDLALFVNAYHHVADGPAFVQRLARCLKPGGRLAAIDWAYRETPMAGLFKRAAEEIREILKAEGVAGMPLGVDLVEPPFLFALQELGVEVRDGQQVMLEARMLKSQDELTLLNMAAAMVDGVYQDIFEALKPGARENEIVALANKRLYEMGSDNVEAINAISGERCSPHPHNFTDRIIRPGDQAFFDIIMSFVGYRTCYYRTFSVGRATKPQLVAYKKAREWMDEAIALIKPGVTTDKIARAFPKAQEIGFESEMAAFGLNFCHGIGLGLHERPIISRLNSFDDPMELQAGMMFAVETYCPATDGTSAARIEEEVIVTPGGAQIITLFPADELPIANRY